jgi:hypothetical protein
LYSAVKARRLALATTSGFGRGGAAKPGATGEAGEAEDIPLFFTWIPILALLSNYDQEICLIHVGTEGKRICVLRSLRSRSEKPP